MHVGLNAHLLSLSTSYRGAGINRYIYSLLQLLPDAGKQHRYTAFLGDKGASGAFPQLRAKVTSLPTGNPLLRILWEQTLQPMELLREGIELLHSLAFVQPLLLPCPGVITIYDLSFLLYPQRLHPLRRLYLRWGTASSARKARRIIAISASTKRDIIRLLGVAESKVDIVPCGVDDDFEPLQSQQALDDFRRRRHLPQQMILFLGTIEPRKNLTTLLAGYASLREKAQLPPLIIAGPKGWHHQEVFSVAEDLGLDKDVIFPGYVPRDELPLWYNTADVFVYPSLYEGFGLPPLEAMACGTPVITSNTSSLPEVVGDAGMLVDPRSADELADAMQRVLSDGELRTEMRTKGLERARQFSWQKAAKETVSVYERSVTGSRN